MSPMLKKVEKAGIKGLKRKRKPFQITAEDFFQEMETVRLLYSELIDNPEPNRVVLIPSVSYGMANIVKNLPFKSGRILLIDEQFPSNVYPWKTLDEEKFKIDFIVAPDSTRRGQSWNEKILKSINEETRLISMGHVHWSDGTLFQLQEIRKRLDDVGGLLVIDGTQSVGALPFSIQEIRPDALICAAYKWLMGPYAIGLAYYGAAFDDGFPIEESWINRKESDDFANLVNYETDYRPGALRYEVGQHSNFILLPMLITALKQVIRWSPVGIQEYCHELMKGAFEEISELNFEVEKMPFRAHHLFSLRTKNPKSIESIKKSLKKNKVSVSLRGKSIRIAPNVYNDEMDVRKLLKALKTPIFAS